MRKNKTVLLFALKAILIYGVLTAPFAFYDAFYGEFFRTICKLSFTGFRTTGFVTFTAGTEPATTVVSIGNYAQRTADGRYPCAIDEFNTRYRGYLPTALLVALILASPVPWKRRTVALFFGLILITGFILLKQWIHILWSCADYPELQMSSFTQAQTKTIKHVYDYYVSTVGPSLVVGVIIWIALTFRRDDILPHLSKIKKSGKG